MMQFLNGVLLALSSSPSAWMVAKATVVLVSGMGGTRLAQNCSAAARHALLAVTFGALLLLPVTCMVAPPLPLAVVRATGPRVVSNIAGTGIASRRVSGQRAAGATSDQGAAPFATSTLIFALWGAGGVIFVAPLLAGLWQVRSMRRSARPWKEGESVVERAACDAGARRRVAVLIHESLEGPMTCGLARPAILLPADAPGWEAAELRRAIVHELEHVRRRDCAIQCLARAVCAVFWFHPLVWMAYRQLSLEAERSCDDVVLGQSDAVAYAEQLVGLARRMTVARRAALLGMANRADLAARVNAVLDGRKRRDRAGSTAVALACSGAAVMVLALSTLRLTAAPQVPATARSVAPAAEITAITYLVMLPVMVVDRNGQPVEGLGVNDFVVTEDGSAQSIRLFEFDGQGAAAREPGFSYYLGYYPTNVSQDGKFRQVRVALRNNNQAVVRSRPGYYMYRQGPVGDGAGSAAAAAPIYQAAEYSDEAWKAKYQGRILLDLDVSAAGQVSKVRVGRTLGLGLDEKAVEAVRRWRFVPRAAGAFQTRVEMNFRLL